ncbi:hypothetical protein [Kitasatospora sp. NPDC057500]|uniref:hypothetical protein n=1 Tax=Kitasatospora sp. NPDC057500 TaxID=3346151 RepID=UPI0036CEEFA6
MNDDLIRKTEPADEHTGADTAAEAPTTAAENPILRQAGRTALLSLAATPAPILVAVVEWWLKTR